MSKPKLVHDTRGAILILGIVMGSLLVGALWHVASLGDAIIWREQAQDAADSAAYENAVWNARGMNVLVIINIVMSVFLFVMIVWRGVMMFLGALVTVGTVSCFVPLPTVITQLLCVAGNAARPVLNNMSSRDRQFTEGISRWLLGMNTAQKVVATATPVIGVVVAADATRSAHEVENVFPFSAALTPTVDRLIASAARDARGIGGTVGRRVSPRMGYVVSLPVQDGDYNLLCEKAGGLLARQFVRVAADVLHNETLADALRRVTDILGSITRSLPRVFCLPPDAPPEDVPEEVRESMANRTREACEQERDQERVFESGPGGTQPMWPDPERDRRPPDREHRGAGTCVPPTCYLIPEFNIERCQNRATEEAMDEARGSGRAPQDAKPSKVWDYAKNGNLFMQSWAAVNKARTMRARDDKGLEIADQQRAGNLVAPEEDEWVWAEAEMFYDCERAWGDCSANAMWAIRWRARLRRIQNMGEMVGDAAGHALIDSLTSGINSTVGSALDRVGTALDLPTILNNYLRDTFNKKVNVQGRVRSWIYGRTDGFFDGDSDQRTLVH